jgi:hypothetical protein
MPLMRPVHPLKSSGFIIMPFVNLFLSLAFSLASDVPLSFGYLDYMTAHSVGGSSVGGRRRLDRARSLGVSRPSAIALSPRSMLRAS